MDGDGSVLETASSGLAGSDAGTSLCEAGDTSLPPGMDVRSHRIAPRARTVKVTDAAETAQSLMIGADGPVGAGTAIESFAGCD
jgi:hypothetical protein